MRPLKLIWLTIVQLVERAGDIPQSMVRALKERRKQAALDALEIERLDRIRNPSRYLGKS
jgi:hypothetical protein